MVLKASPFLVEIPGHITNEFGASLPLADPIQPWLPVVYGDGSHQLIDLKTALLDAHRIDRFELGHTVVTHSLYRLLLTLAYGILQESGEMPERAADFNAWQSAALETNAGFDAAAVGAYFESYADRFFLVHPRLPFLQDPSLYRYATPGGLSRATAGEMRTAFNGAVHKGSSVSDIHPLVASYVTTAKCHQWGLAPEIFTSSMFDAEKVLAMFGALMYQRNSLGSIGRGERTFTNDAGTPTADTHSTISPLRRVVHYLPATGSFFRDLVISMQNVSFETLEKHAEWERPVANTGWLEGIGLDAGDRSLWFGGADSPREAMDDSQMSILFVPTTDFDIRVIRRNRYRNKTAKANFAQSKEEQKTQAAAKKAWEADRKAAVDANPSYVATPLPEVAIGVDHLVPAWNPYIARRQNGINRPLSAHESLSEETSLSHADIMRVPLLGNASTFHQPLWFNVFDSSRRDVLDRGLFPVEIRVLVNGGKIDQDVDFNDFELRLPSTGLASDPVFRENIRTWMKVGDKVADSLAFRVKKAAEPRRLDSGKMSSEAKRLFWAQFSDIFRAAVFGHVGGPSIDAYATEVRNLALACFDSATDVVRLQNPLVHARLRSFLSSDTRKVFDSNDPQ